MYGGCAHSAEPFVSRNEMLGTPSAVTSNERRFSSLAINQRNAGKSSISSTHQIRRLLSLTAKPIRTSSTPAN